MPLSVLFFCGTFALTFVFIACELGQRLTDAFEEIEDIVDHFDWYLFPNEIKRILLIVMVIAQQPVEMECFGSISCSRVTFKNVGIDGLFFL